MHFILQEKWVKREILHLSLKESEHLAIQEKAYKLLLDTDDIRFSKPFKTQSEFTLKIKVIWHNKLYWISSKVIFTHVSSLWNVLQRLHFIQPVCLKYFTCLLAKTMGENINHFSKQIPLICFQSFFNVVFKSSGCLIASSNQRVVVFLIFYCNSGDNEKEANL